MELKISCKSVAQRRCTIESILYRYDNPIQTVRDLIKETVKINISEYNKRQESSELLKVLTKSEIEDKSTTGKIGFGRIYGERKPDIADAIKTAIECFEDGMFVVFVDGEQVSQTDETILLHDGSEITFVRMTMLSGRMW